MIFHSAGFQMTDSNRRQTRAILHSSLLSSHSKMRTISSSGIRSNSGPARYRLVPCPFPRLVRMVAPSMDRPHGPLPFALPFPPTGVFVCAGLPWLDEVELVPPPDPCVPPVVHEAGIVDCCWPDGDGDTSVW